MGFKPVIDRRSRGTDPPSLKLWRTGGAIPSFLLRYDWGWFKPVIDRRSELGWRFLGG